MPRRTSTLLGPDGAPVVHHAAGPGPLADALRHEATLLGLARGPGVVDLVASGDEPDGSAWLSTRYVAGGTLHDLLRREGEPAATAALARVAGTLADLHERGIVHGRCTADHVLGGAAGASLCGFSAASLADGPADGSIDASAFATLVSTTLTSDAETSRRARRTVSGLDAPSSNTNLRAVAAELWALARDAGWVEPVPGAATNRGGRARQRPGRADGTRAGPRQRGGRHLAGRGGDLAGVAAGADDDLVSPAGGPAGVGPPQAEGPPPRSRPSRRGVPLPVGPLPGLGRRTTVSASGDPGGDPDARLGAGRPSRPGRGARAARRAAVRRLSAGCSVRLAFAGAAACLTIIAAVTLQLGGPSAPVGTPAPSPTTAPPAVPTTGAPAAPSPGDRITPPAPADRQVPAPGRIWPREPAPAPAPEPPTPSTVPTEPPLGAGTSSRDGTGPVVEHAGARYAIGAPGDIVVLGDWDCDGAPTPAVVRPADGSVWTFRSWTTGPDELAAEPHGRAPDPIAATARPGQDGCDVLAVATADGNEVVLRPGQSASR